MHQGSNASSGGDSLCKFFIAKSPSLENGLRIVLSWQHLPIKKFPSLVACKLQISYPPVNGASQGNYFLPKSHKLAVFEKKAYKTALAEKWQTFCQMVFGSGLTKDQIIFCKITIIGVIVDHRQTDRQIL